MEGHNVDDDAEDMIQSEDIDFPKSQATTDIQSSSGAIVNGSKLIDLECDNDNHDHDNDYYAEGDDSSTDVNIQDKSEDNMEDSIKASVENILREKNIQYLTSSVKSSLSTTNGRHRRRKHLFKPYYKRLFTYLGLEYIELSPFFSRYVSQFLTILGGIQEGVYSVMYIVMLMLLVMYVYSIAAIIFFRGNDPYHFRSVEISMLTMLSISLFDDWGGVMYVNAYGCNEYSMGVYTNNPEDDAKQLGGLEYCKHPSAANMGNFFFSFIFFGSYVFFTSLMILSLVIGNIGSAMQLSSTHIRKVFAQRIIIWQQKDAQAMIKTFRQNGSTSVLGRNSREIVRVMRLAFNGDDIFKPPRYTSRNLNEYMEHLWVRLCAFCSRMADSDHFNNAMSVAIIYSGIVAGIETEVNDGDTTTMAKSVEISNIVLQYLFTVEVVIKLLAEGNYPWTYFTDAWNSLDFIIVLLTWLADFVGFNVIFLRLVRLFRVMKLIQTMPRLQAIVQSVINSFTSTIYVLLIFVVYILIVVPIARKLFEGNDPFHFGSWMISICTIFQVVTFDNFIQILGVNLYGCDVYPMDGAGIAEWYTKYCSNPEPQFANAAIFFSVNVVIGGFVGTTLFIGIMIASMVHAEEQLEAKAMLYNRVRMITSNHGIPKPIIDKYQQIFDFLDITHSSRIGRAELKYAFQLTESNVTDKEIDRIFRCIDLDGSQLIDFAEFVYFMMEVHFTKYRMRKTIDKLHTMYLKMKRIFKAKSSSSKKVGERAMKSDAEFDQEGGHFKGVLPDDVEKRVSSRIQPVSNETYEGSEVGKDEHVSLMRRASIAGKAFMSAVKSVTFGGKSVVLPSPVKEDDLKEQRVGMAPSIMFPYNTKKDNLCLTKAVEEDLIKALDKEHSFVFIKPHANNEKVQNFVRATLQSQGIEIKNEGELSSSNGADFQKKVLNQYFELGTAATKNALFHKGSLHVRKSFYNFFGVRWDDALCDGSLLSCADAIKKKGLAVSELSDAWIRSIRKGSVVKLNSRLYCGYINDVEGHDAFYVLNGFFAGMIESFWEEGASVHYFLVEWNSPPPVDAETMSNQDNPSLTWDDFNVIMGDTDPANVLLGGDGKASIRHQLYLNWKELGLSFEPNILFNCIHYSQSAFEAFVSRHSWLNAETASDPFGIYLTLAKIPQQTIIYWCTNPIVDDCTTMSQMMHGLGWESCLNYLLQYYNESHPLLEEEASHEQDRHKLAKLMSAAAGNAELMSSLHQQTVQNRHAHLDNHSHNSGHFDHHSFTSRHRVRNSISLSFDNDGDLNERRASVCRTDVHVARSTIIAQLKQIASQTEDQGEDSIDDRLSVALAKISNVRANSSKNLGK